MIVDDHGPKGKEWNGVQDELKAGFCAGGRNTRPRSN
jgi:hypothetical protein